MKIFKEWDIRKTLRKLSRQRVATVLQPGNVWVIERAVRSDEKTDSNLKTCYLRGWVEPIENAIPQGDLTSDGRLPNNWFNRIGPVYRITEAGWSVINRTHQWTMITVVIAALTIILGLNK